MIEENKGIQVSYSAIDSYLSCSEKYRLERIVKIIPDSVNMAFCFGSATDAASEVIFKAYMKDAAPFNREEMINLFEDKLTNYEFQGEMLYIPTHAKIKYSKADVQPELLTKEDLADIEAYILEESDLDVGKITDFIDYFKDTKIKLEEEIVIYNYIAWYCMLRKGILILDRLVQWAKDEIKEVVSIQRKIEIVNDEGDKLIGYLDLEAILKRDNKIRTIDLKTASNPKQQYPDDKISKSMQLTIYANETQKEVAYVILGKTIKKKAPRVDIRELYGTISEQQLDETFEKIDVAMNGIKNGIYTKNTNHCFAWGACQYMSLCFKGEMRGLVEKVKKEDK